MTTDERAAIRAEVLEEVITAVQKSKTFEEFADAITSAGPEPITKDNIHSLTVEDHIDRKDEVDTYMSGGDAA